MCVVELYYAIVKLWGASLKFNSKIFFFIFLADNMPQAV